MDSVDLIRPDSEQQVRCASPKSCPEGLSGSAARSALGSVWGQSWIWPFCRHSRYLPNPGATQMRLSFS